VVVRRLLLVVLVRIVHEIDQVGVVILDGVPVEEDVLLAERTILLLFFYNFLVTLASGVVVGDWRLKLDHGR